MRPLIVSEALFLHKCDAKNQLLPMKRIALLLAIFLSVFTLNAQQRVQRGTVTGTVTLIPDNEDEDDSPGTGAVVIVVPEVRKDTLYAVVGDKGTFTIRNVPQGRADVTISLLGYEEMRRSMTIKAGENKIIVELRPSDIMLAEAVLTETATVLSVKEDTLVFNPNAVKYNKGEMAIDLLEQMPGVKVSDDGVSILDEELATVYIDGALLFSDDPMRALEQLPAEEVAGIKSFTEYANKDPNHVVSLNEEKQRVIDIETKNKPKMVVNGNFLTGAGFDTDSTYHKFRYTAGGTVSLSSESLQADLTVNVNNINDASARRRGNAFRNARSGGAADLRAISVSAGVTRRWMSKEARNFVLASIGGNYSYTNNYTVNESRTQQTYFPTDAYSFRESVNASHSDQTSGVHRFSLNGRKSLKDGFVRLNANYSITDGHNNSLSSNYNYQDQLPRQGTSSSTVSDTRNQSFSSNFNFNKGFAGKVYLGMGANFSSGNSDGFSAKVDTTTSTIAVKVLEIDSSGGNRSYGFTPSITYRFSNRHSIELGYGFTDTHRVSEKIAMDVTDPYAVRPDSVNTERLTHDNREHRGNITYRQYFEKLQANLRVTVGYGSTTLGRVDHFPEESSYSKPFNAWTGRVWFGTDRMVDDWTFNYTASNSVPSLEQVRPRLDNSNLYSVSAGNPNLRQSTSHNFSFDYTTVLGKEARRTVSASENQRRASRNFSSFSFSASFRVNNDVIVNRRIYYAADTYLPDYDYTMPAQSTLNTYENAGHSYSASVRAELENQLKKINSVLRINTSMNWDSSPSYVNDKLTVTQNSRPTLTLAFNTNFSRNFRLNVRGQGSYIYSSNSEKDDVSYFTERLTVGFEINNVLKHLYAGGNYNKVFTQGLNYAQINDNILNLNIGARFGPRNNIDIAVSANDLLNQNTGFSTSMGSDFVRYSWTHNFGRYILFTLAYRFNSMGGGNGGGGFRGPGGGGFRGPGGGGGGGFRRW
jgi:hypothetical protein